MADRFVGGSGKSPNAAGDDVDAARNTSPSPGLPHTHEVIYRVTRLGGIPAPDIPAAVRRLVASDMRRIVATAAKVDADVQRFRDENAHRVDAGGDSGAGDILAGVDAL